MRYIFIVLIILKLTPVYAQVPDYSMLDPTLFNPEVDPNIDMFIGSWKESLPRHSHGSLIERDILTTGDPLKPPTKAAVLKYVSRFTYATLEAGTSTTPTTLAGEQEIFYIISGEGTISAGNETADLFSGIAVLMPAELEFTMKNTGDSPLTMYLIAEPYPEGFRLNKEMLVVDENKLPFDRQSHWSGMVKQLFRTGNGLSAIESILTCTQGPMTFFHPHSHGEGVEEVWTTISGETYFLMGKQVRLQPPGTAYLIPVDGNSAHGNFNVSDNSFKMLYFARYADHELRK